MSHWSATRRAVTALVLSFAVLVSLAACSAGPAAGPVIGEPVLSVPSPVKPGETVGISVPVSGPANGVLKYEWTAPAGQGQIVDGQGTSGITYRAPDEPNTYKIGLKVTGAGVSLERSVFITVQGIRVEPAPTNGGPTPKPVTAMPCRSIRPPFEDTGKFGGTATIDVPKDGATGYPAESGIPTAGIFTGLPEGATLWLLSYTENDMYYAQSSTPDKGLPMAQNEGKWRVTTWLGAKGGNPECFDLVLIAADQELSTFLTNWLKDSAKAGRFQGISLQELQGYHLTEKAAITVQTKD